uniref:Uncharacterized protein n=1 Tax=Lotharella oceanica TaxID=641309 RepID=A0A7S2TSS9_9EUKA|mmetsp:Transcript_26433/g.49393  ORF Transcript_26433/g.49393 Transcript_26433/m.49393 type:complete len:344 (+) Transcript_26433:26-1057(+)
MNLDNAPQRFRTWRSSRITANTYGPMSISARRARTPARKPPATPAGRSYPRPGLPRASHEASGEPRLQVPLTTRYEGSGRGIYSSISVKREAPGKFVRRQSPGGGKRQGKHKTLQFKSIVLQFDAALRTLHLKENVAAESPNEARTRICFRYFDEMLRRYSSYSRLGARLRDLLLRDVYCVDPGSLNRKRIGDEPVPFYVIAQELKTDLKDAKQELGKLKVDIRDKEERIIQLEDELSRAQHLKLQFVEMEHTMKQNASITKRLQKANDVLMAHNEDLEEQILQASKSKFNLAIENQLRSALDELEKSKAHAEDLSKRLEEELQKNHKLFESVASLKAQASKN